MGRQRTLSNSDINYAFILRSDGLSLAEIAGALSVSRQYVMMILSRRAYADVKVPAKILDKAAQHVRTKAIKRAIRDGAILANYHMGCTQKEIAAGFNVSVGTVGRIVNS